MIGIVDEVGKEIHPRALLEEVTYLLLTQSFVGQFIEINHLLVCSFKQFVKEKGENLFVERQGKIVEHAQYFVQEG